MAKQASATGCRGIRYIVNRTDADENAIGDTKVECDTGRREVRVENGCIPNYAE